MSLSPPPYLFALRLNQTQRFIAAARSTRDLWSGSSLVSLLMGHAARVLAAQPQANMLFPDASVLSPGSVVRGPTGIGNKLVAIVSATDVARLVPLLREAMWQALLDEAAPLRPGGAWHPALSGERMAWQLLDALDLHAAWVPYQEQQHGLCFLRLERLLNERKRSRLFSALPGRGQVSKESVPALSVLDGRNESVLLAPHECPARWLTRGEDLDAIGLLKRVRAAGVGFPSLMRVALQPWVEQQPDQLIDELAQHFSQIAAWRPEWATSPDVRGTPMARLSWDCELLHAQPRMQAIEQARQDLAAGVSPQAGQALEALEALPKIDAQGRYVCVLMADGDRLGELLCMPDLTADDHARLSRALASFAQHAVGLVNSHGAACVYAGGDDVLAFCPVDRALTIAAQLAALYRQTMRAAWPARLSEHAEQLTMSVGVGMGHVATPMGQLRQLAHRANALAKEGADGQGLRHALGVVLAPRGGAEVALADHWAKPGVSGLDERLNTWMASFGRARGLTKSTSYELQELVRRFSDPKSWQCLQDEAQHLLRQRLHASEESAVFTHYRDYVQQKAQVHQHLPAAALKELGNEWYVARWLHQHTEQHSDQPEALQHDPA
jgi:CRISPR-associated protein Cmr2